MRVNVCFTCLKGICSRTHAHGLWKSIHTQHGAGTCALDPDSGTNHTTCTSDPLIYAEVQKVPALCVNDDAVC